MLTSITHEKFETFLGLRIKTGMSGTEIKGIKIP